MVTSLTLHGCVCGPVYMLAYDIHDDLENPPEYQCSAPHLTDLGNNQLLVLLVVQPLHLQRH